VRLRARMPSSASAVTLLPHPTRRRAERLRRPDLERDAVDACTIPRCVLNARAGPRRQQRIRCGTQLGIEGFARARRRQVEAERRDDDREARNDREPRRRLQYWFVSVSIAPHSGRAGFWSPRPEKLGRPTSMMAVAKRKRSLDDHRRDRVRQDVGRRESSARTPVDRAARTKSFSFCASTDPRRRRAKDRNLREADGDHDVEETRAERGDDPDREQESGMASMMSITRITVVSIQPARTRDRPEDDPERESTETGDDATSSESRAP